MICKLFNSV